MTVNHLKLLGCGKEATTAVDYRALAFLKGLWMSNLATEEDLTRARSDPAFRQQMLAEHLDRLLEALNRMRRAGNKTAESSRQIREGVDLAVKLADRLHETGDSSGGQAA